MAYGLIKFTLKCKINQLTSVILHQHWYYKCYESV